MNKRILLIAPLFFDYYLEMINELEEMGYEVDYVCDAPSNSNLIKSIARINKNLIRPLTEIYFYKKVYKLIKTVKYNNVIIVAGMTFSFSANMISKIKGFNPNTKISMYQWDSETNLPYAKSIHPYVDYIYSFDSYDCETNKNYIFLPLFYIKAYEDMGKNKNDDYLYDCAYVGTAHPKKIVDIDNMSKALKELMPRQYFYNYMPSRLKYLYHKIINNEYKNMNMSRFMKEKLSSSEIRGIYSKSKYILDTPQAGQTGLTIRTIECLGAKKKLITTNKLIKKYDFYRESNIYVFDGVLNENNIFFKSPYIELEKEIYEKYSLRNWLKCILNEER